MSLIVTQPAFWGRNSVAIEILKRALPDLKTEKGDHYGEILESLFTARILELGSENGSRAEKANVPNGKREQEDGFRSQREPETGNQEK